MGGDMTGLVMYEQPAPVGSRTSAGSAAPGQRASLRASADPSTTPASPTPGSPTQAWSPNLPDAFSIAVDSPGSVPRGAWGSASSRGLFPLSAMGRLEHFCTTPAQYPLRIRFYLDSMATPRPQPFQPPTLSVIADFTPTGGAPRRIADVADSAPRYDGPGWPLAPAFGDLFTASSSASGALGVRAQLSDPATAGGVTYRDSVACELVPCA